MEIYVFDKGLRLLGIVEAYDYFRWSRKYSACGSFTLKAVANDQNLSLLQRDNFLWKNDDPEAGTIESVELSMQDRETVEVGGRFATSLLGRRIVWGTELLQGDLSAAVSGLLSSHLIAPADSARKIDGVLFSSPALGIPVNTQISYKNLLTTVEELCDANDVGVRTLFDPAQKTMTVNLYRRPQTPAVFSREFENITGQIFLQSARDYSSVARVGGEGEGAERVMATVGSAAGLERYELFVDAKDLRSEDFGGGYAGVLALRGQIKLNERQMVCNFDAEIHPYGNLKYKTDFDLGDIVTVVSRRWGVTMQTRITEIEESYDGDEMSLRAVFGRGAMSLIQKLKGR